MAQINLQENMDAAANQVLSEKKGVDKGQSNSEVESVTYLTNELIENHVDHTDHLNLPQMLDIPIQPDCQDSIISDALSARTTKGSNVMDTPSGSKLQMQFGTVETTNAQPNNQLNKINCDCENEIRKTQQVEILQPNAFRSSSIFNKYDNFIDDNLSRLEEVSERARLSLERSSPVLDSLADNPIETVVPPSSYGENFQSVVSTISTIVTNCDVLTANSSHTAVDANLATRAIPESGANESLANLKISQSVETSTEALIHPAPLCNDVSNYLMCARIPLTQQPESLPPEKDSNENGQAVNLLSDLISGVSTSCSSATDSSGGECITATGSDATFPSISTPSPITVNCSLTDNDFCKLPSETYNSQLAQSKSSVSVPVDSENIVVPSVDQNPALQCSNVQITVNEERTDDATPDVENSINTFLLHANVPIEPIPSDDDSFKEPNTKLLDSQSISSCSTLDQTGEPSVIAVLSPAIISEAAGKHTDDNRTAIDVTLQNSSSQNSVVITPSSFTSVNSEPSTNLSSATSDNNTDHTKSKDCNSEQCGKSQDEIQPVEDLRANSLVVPQTAKTEYFVSVSRSTDVLPVHENSNTAILKSNVQEILSNQIKPISKKKKVPTATLR